MRRNERIIADFSASLLELLESGIPLDTSLEVIHSQGGAGGSVRKLAGEILGKLAEGYTFSASLAMSSVHADEKYITLVSASESGGSITSALRFITERAERRREAEARIKTVSVYPAVVVLVALAGSIALLCFQGEFLVSIPAEDLYGGVFTAVCVLFAGIAAVALYVKKSMTENSLQPVFFALGFLSEAGFDLASSLDIAIMYSADDKKLSNALLGVQRMLAEGSSLGDAFRSFKVFPKDVAARLSLADIHGNTGAVCGSIADAIEKKDARRRNACMQLIEPLLIICTGLYILILAETIVLPFMTSYGGL